MSPGRDVVSSIAVVAGFVVSRIAYRLAGVRFDASPLERFWQIVDPTLLQERLFESLVHLHSQPPLFNMTLGLFLKVFGDHATTALAAGYFVSGIVLTLSLHELLLALGAGRRLSVVLTLVFVTSPPTVLYESWLFYTYPVATMLCASAMVLHRFLRRGKGPAAFGFFALLATVALTRSLFHPLWYLAVWIGLVVACRDHRKKLVMAGALPLLLIAGWYVKNPVILGSPPGGTWLGMSLSKTTTFLIARSERERMVEEGRLSAFALIPPFSELDAYREVLPPFTPSGVRILDDERKAGGGVNFHHAAYIDVGRAYLDDALRVLRARPEVHLRGWSLSYLICFLPASDSYFLLRNRARIESLDRLYSHLLCGQLRYARGSTVEAIPRLAPSRRLLGVGWWLLLGYALGVAYGASVVWRAVKAGPRDGVQALVTAFVLWNVVWVVVVGNAVELGENNRFRFVTDPLCLALVGAFIGERLRRVRRRKESRA